MLCNAQQASVSRTDSLKTPSLRYVLERRRRALKAHQAWARRHKIKPASDPNTTGDLFEDN